MMNSVNGEMNAVTVGCMAIGPEHRVLDIGFGGGVALGLMAQAAARGTVVGVEMSPTMLAQARRSCRVLLEEGRLHLVGGVAEQLPFADACFDRICTVNTVYFWKDAPGAAREVWRVLKPGGTFVLSFRPAKDMHTLPFTRYGFTLYDREAIGRLLKDAGFGQIHFREQRDAHLRFACAMAGKD
ncbi:MAG: class I SAM-dependent methyltransferase [Pseudomonadota bacterium]|nr:class I SAM-dependent methyltransferase [Pseudomonadota bacterium]